MAKLLFEWDYSKYPGAKKYPHLFKPIQIGNLMIPNRIVYAATEDNLNSHDGFVTDADVAYIRNRARGVVGGIMFMQGVYMDEARKGQGYVGQAACWDDKFIPGLKRLADAIHQERAVAGFQLMDCGRVGAADVPFGHGPSAVPQRLRIFRAMHEMSKAEVKEMVQQHLDAARRGLEAGFDAMEISGIVGYLISNFVSSYTNRRTDEYGGDIHGRMRVVVEIIEGLKKLCPPEVPVGIRLCAEELLDDVRGNTPDESMESYRISEKAGVDYLSVTAGWQESIVPVISRDVPQVFQSQDNGNLYGASDFYEAPGTSVAYNIDSDNNPLNRDFNSVNEAESADNNLSWFDYTGNSVVIQRVGGNLQFVRPLNGGNPFKRAPWNVVLGLSAQEVRPINFAGDSQPFAVATNNFDNNGSRVPIDSVVCVAYNCATSNQLVGLRLAATRNTLDDPRNPTKGNFLSLGTEQFFSVGPDSPTFNRLRATYTHYIPVRWTRFYKGCRPKAGETEDCKQALAFHFSAGSAIGDLPPYEAFCIGGGNSVRGFYDCDLGVGRSFGEATIEYRFPLFSIVSGELFVDGGTAFGTQKNVPGNPGALLGKPGNGFSVGTGLIVTTPVGPLRLEVASRDFTGDWRFNLGVGWKF